MQLSTKKSYVSVISACCLLVGPAAIYRAGYNLFHALQKQELRRRTTTEIWDRDLRCEASRNAYSMANPAAALPTTAQAAIADGTPNGRESRITGEEDASAKLKDSLSSTDDLHLRKAEAFIDLEYLTATKEIEERLGNENVLFGLKFTLVGAIMAVLFSLFGGKTRFSMDFERFIQKRRVGVFFVAALLSSAIVDTRLRFNAKVIESLGEWVWCVERFKGRSILPTAWEHFLHLQLDAGIYPVLRYFCHFLTALLYSVTLYLFIVMPRTLNRSTKTMLTQGGRLFFILLFFVSQSYDGLHFNLDDFATYGAYAQASPSFLHSSIPSLLLAMLLAILGARTLRQALDYRFALSNAFVQTGEIAGAAKKDLLEKRVMFACFHAPDSLIEEVEQEALRGTGEDRAIIKILNRSEATPKFDYDMAKGWRVKDPLPVPLTIAILDALRGRRIRGPSEAQHKMESGVKKGIVERQRLDALNNLVWIREEMEGWSEHEAELAEEELWAAYFRDSLPKSDLSPEASRMLTDKILEQLLSRLAQVDQLDAKLEHVEQLFLKKLDMLVLPVVIDIRDRNVTEKKAEPVVSAVVAYLVKFGLKPDARETWETSIGSFVARFRATLKALLGRDEVAKIVQDIESGLTNRFVRLPGAEAGFKEAEATSGLIKALDGIENAVIAIGPVILVKRTTGHEASIFTIPLTDQIRMAMNVNPASLSSAQAFCQLLGRLQEGQRRNLADLEG